MTTSPSGNDDHDTAMASAAMLPVSDTGVVSRPHCYLLELPKELRLEIYELLLKPAELTIRSYDSRAFTGLPDEERATIRFYALQPQEGLASQVLRVCRQIYGEARNTLYNPPCLFLRPSFTGTSIKDAKDLPIDVTLLRTAGTLEKLRIDLTVTPHTAKEDIDHSARLRWLLGRTIDAKQMLVVIHDESEDNGDVEDHVYSQDPDDPMRSLGKVIRREPSMH